MSCDVVTGAFGYSGAAIARELLTAGRRVRTLTSHPRNDHDIEALPLDFTDADGLARSLDGADTLYNTYWVRFSHGQNTQDQAVRNSRVLFEAAKRAGIQRVVHVSILHAAPDSPYPYFRGKAEVERELASTGIPHTILRPAILFGGAPGDAVLVNNIAWLLRRLPVFAIGGDGAYHVRPIDVDDLARLATGAWTGDVTKDAVGPQSLAFREMVTAIRTAVGSRAVLVRVPGRVVPPMAAVLGVLLRDVLLTAEEYKAMAAGLADSSAPATGATVFTDWVAAHGSDLGRGYANELDRHYRLTPYVRRRFSARQTRRRPDQSSSMAATFTSTRPSGSAISRITLSVMSLRWPAARRGQAAQMAPSGNMRRASAGSSTPRSAEVVKNAISTSAAPTPASARSAGGSVRAQPAGRFTMPSRSPGLSPSLPAWVTMPGPMILSVSGCLPGKRTLSWDNPVTRGACHVRGHRGVQRVLRQRS
jgi:uncharacterized protein YbjT (DUF2867 family)